MSLIGGVRAVLAFEFRRTLTLPRMTIWFLLTLFPPFIVGLLRYVGGGLPTAEAWTILLYILIPEVTCLLGLLLWMCPAIQSELEGKTWVYLAVRPHGRRTVLLGKFLTALAWSVSSALVALALALWIAAPPDRARILVVLSALVMISCLGRGAAYSLFAVALPQRAMVFAVAYTMIFEYLVGFIPALINQLTVQFHLRCLLIRWMGWARLPEGLKLFFDDSSVAYHLLVLAAYCGVVLGTSVILLEQRQFASSEEG